MTQKAVVMFTPPNRGEIWYGRCDRAIDVVKQTGGILVLAGDANGGSDLDLFAQRAVESGLEEQCIVKAFNGHDVAWKNTRGDARAAAEVLDIIGDIAEVVVVTCYYHMQRAVIALMLELERVGLIVESILEAEVEDPNVDVDEDLLENELMGCYDYLVGNPQISRGSLIGKPEFATD